MYIFSNLATSIDGKIATASRAHFPLGTPADREQMRRLRRRADAVLMGASSLRSFRRPLLIRKNGKPGPRQILNVIISSGLEGISPSWPFFKEQRTTRLLFITKPLPEARRNKFEKSSEIVLLKKGRPIATQIVAELGRRGIRNLLVEGGGSVMWDFISQDLIEEINLTITPRILGGSSAPTLVDGKGFSPGEVRNFKLSSFKKLGDELYLVYLASGKKA
ncbi:MAG TPA: hypothetical protein DCS07_01655 [Bdellovibrionales bacterium]|nr:MAG: hypothetical protein A2Z97_06040 [Bdellovibrionales bacterium GWB1_52_6]OFZ04335.1 MAG: hypothetical protein A2X97_06730 [Bdellovibrionales bacterium GWA1_52_35]HAR41330.1 hypothetical protein [Bdellovibrionales bacterium]HCM40813.1 hypothetical protein [Bdellovibrionales bacterium]